MRQRRLEAWSLTATATPDADCRVSSLPLKCQHQAPIHAGEDASYEE